MHVNRAEPLYALPVQWPFPCRTNSDYGEELWFQDGDQPVDLTGYTFQADVKREPFALTPLQSFGMAATASDEGFFLIDAAGGILQVRFMWETIKAMFDAVYPDNLKGSEMTLYYDLLATAPDGFREAWLCGPFSLDKGITNG